MCCVLLNSPYWMNSRVTRHAKSVIVSTLVFHYWKLRRGTGCQYREFYTTYTKLIVLDLTYHLPLTSYHLPLTNFNLLLTVFLPKPTIFYKINTTNYLPFIKYLIPFSTRHLPLTTYQLPITTKYHLSSIILHSIFPIPNLDIPKGMLAMAQTNRHTDGYHGYHKHSDTLTDITTYRLN